MKITISCCFLIILGLFPDIALAQELSSSGVMNDVLNRFHSAASTWAPTIEGTASRLFWTLVTISMVWTFGMMALRKADIGEFFAELVRFTIFTGFYWWLLSNATHGMNIAGSIVDSLQQLGAEAGGLGSSKLGPSSILDMGFELYDRTVEATSELSWKEFATALMMELMALAVLVVLAIISVNLLLLLAASWILLYAGVFFLGFGGSRWTSDMAINYYKSILGIAAQLLSMVLIVAIGKQFLLDYHNKISENMASQELAVMLVISLCLLFLVNKVPPMISGLVSGGNIGTMGIGSFGAGAAMGTVMTAASMGATGMKIAGGAIVSGAANATSGISAIKAAFEQAQSSMADGAMPSGGSETTQNRSAESNTDSGDSPFSKAAGFDSTDRSSVSPQNRTNDADSSIRDDMAGTSADRTEFSDNTLSGSDKHSMNQSTTDNDEVNDFVNRNKSDK